MTPIAVFPLLFSAFFNSATCELPSCDSLLNVPESHILPFASHYPGYCSYDPSKSDEKDVCWGYEDRCENVTSSFSCENDAVRDAFFRQSDFGYVKSFLSRMTTICEPGSLNGSSLVCSENLTFCRGRNLAFDFGGIPDRRSEVLRYKMDVLNPGQISGTCSRFHEKRLRSQLSHMSPLQSWAPELRNIVDKDTHDCDVIVETPTWIVKLDASVNMYHHFCDFFNLYATLHATHGPRMYDKDLRILIWENREYRSAFDPVWSAFTDHRPLWNLNTFQGRKVCFKSVVFPLLPRMIYGLYYNSPIIQGCRGSRLFEAFSEFILHRLHIQIPYPSGIIRVTILARETNHRRILNQDKLVEAAEVAGFEIRLAKFTHKVDFRRQLEIITSTDVLVGIHGAGLTHCLFLPKWAVVLELTDCEDPSCYKDLTRLAGLKHMGPLETAIPEDPSISKKFTNYSFDEREFILRLREAASYVRSHPRYLTRVKDEL